MSLRLVLRWLTRIIVSAAILSTTYLYLYPVWFGCAFPSTTASTYHGFKQTVARHAGYPPAPNNTDVAPFRLLVLADPQLEGDSSLPDPEDAFLPRLSAHGLRLRRTPLNGWYSALAEAVKELVSEDIPRSLQATRKTLDLFGNDYYLAHIYRTLHWWSTPTHVTVLGDLIGSQWVSDDEFTWRAWRYWNRVFANSKKPADQVMSLHESDKDGHKTFHILRSDSPEQWEKTIINAVGNHDIGYAGDISQSRIERFEKAFGKTNWDVHFTYPYELLPASYLIDPRPVPTLHLVVLNSMLLDTPALDSSVQSETYDYINNLIVNRLEPVESRNSTFTLLLTHVPLHKPEGICVDAPFFDYWTYTDANGVFKSGGLKEQNHLSEHASYSGILQAIYGMSGNYDAAAGGKGRNGLILTGHDHEGCDTVHYIERTIQQDADKKGDVDSTFNFNDPDPVKPWSWKSIRTKAYPPLVSTDHTSATEIVTSLREVTLRSMMGEFGGNAGLLSLWYDFDAQTWRYEMQMCPLGVQHVWWAVHVIDIVAILVVFGWVVEWIVRARTSGMHAKGNKVAMGEVTKEKSVAVTKKVADAGTKIEVRSVVTVSRDNDGNGKIGGVESSSSSVVRSASQRRRKG